MDSNELLNKMKDRDMVAYHHLTEHYGWKIYSHLQTRFKEKEKVDAALNETFRQFYNTVAGSEDPIEAMLMSFADRVCQNMTQENKQPVPTVEKKKKEEKPKKEKVKKEKSEKSGKIGKILFTFTFSFLILGIFVALWVIMGLLMDLGVMPDVDLGYSWFSANIFPWF